MKCRRRSSTRTTPSPDSSPVCNHRSIPPRRAAWSIPAIPASAARHRADRQEQHRAAPRGGVGSEGRRPHQRARGVRHVLRRARRTGRLLPERRAVAAVHAADRAEHADADHDRGSARRGRRPAESVPAGADDHRLGRRLQVAVRAALQRSACSGSCSSSVGAEVSYVGSRGYNLPIFMEVNPGVYTAGQTAQRRAVDAGVLAGAADVPGGEVLVRLAAGQRPHAADARPQLPRQLHARQDHRSRVGPEHRRRSAAGDAGHAGRRGEHRARARVRKRPGAVRCAASLRRQLRLRAAGARDSPRRSCVTSPAAGS